MDKQQVFDELLIIKCQEGNAKAFELFIKRWNQKLIYFIYGFTHDIEAARDVAQETWIAVHKGIYKLQETNKYRTWLYRVAHNKAMDHIRANKRRVPTETISEEKTRIQQPDQSTVKLDIDTLLGQLPEKYKVVLTLFYREKQSIKDIATIMSIPEGTVKSRIFHAREYLKKNIKIIHNETY